MMTFNEAKAKFETNGTTPCPACRYMGKRRPYYRTRAPGDGLMEWMCEGCGHPEYSDPAEPLT